MRPAVPPQTRHRDASRQETRNSQWEHVRGLQAPTAPHSQVQESVLAGWPAREALSCGGRGPWAPPSSGTTSALGVGVGPQGCWWDSPSGLQTPSPGLQDTGVGGMAEGRAGPRARHRVTGRGRSQSRGMESCPLPVPAAWPAPPLAQLATKIRSCRLFPGGPGLRGPTVRERWAGRLDRTPRALPPSRWLLEGAAALGRPLLFAVAPARGTWAWWMCLVWLVLLLLGS